MIPNPNYVQIPDTALYRNKTPADEYYRALGLHQCIYLDNDHRNAAEEYLHLNASGPYGMLWSLYGSYYYLTDMDSVAIALLCK